MPATVPVFKNLVRPFRQNEIETAVPPSGRVRCDDDDEMLLACCHQDCHESVSHNVVTIEHNAALRIYILLLLLDP